MQAQDDELSRLLLAGNPRRLFGHLKREEPQLRGQYLAIHPYYLGIVTWSM